MSHIIFNLGTGPVDGATAAQAHDNMVAFVAALDLDGVEFECAGDDGEGRWAFDVNRNGRTCRVDMPGVGELDKYKIRPRLYVDGNSWYWRFARDVAREALGGGAP